MWRSSSNAAATAAQAAPRFRKKLGNNRRRLVARLQAETDDVLAARAYLLTRTFVDAKRIGVMGWSFGGIVTMFAVSRGNDFAVAVNQGEAR